jgi:hypothetical protein
MGMSTAMEDAQFMDLLATHKLATPPTLAGQYGFDLRQQTSITPQEPVQ